MSGEFRTQYDAGYVAAIGRAVYIFAVYEWNVAHTIEKLRTGFLHEYLNARRPMTAHTIWERFEKEVNEFISLDEMSVSKLKESAKTFGGFVRDRNELLHAHVYSEPDGRQQLIYQGRGKTRTWSVTEIDDLSHRFENSSIVLRDLTKEVWNF
jgi:hypothetical protein